jgi:hypothetical protein
MTRKASRKPEPLWRTLSRECPMTITEHGLDLLIAHGLLAEGRSGSITSAPMIIRFGMAVPHRTGS